MATSTTIIVVWLMDHTKKKIMRYTYEVISKIFQTRATIYTAVVVARSTGRW